MSLCKDTSDDRNITVILTVRTNVEYQIELTSKLQNAHYRQHSNIPSILIVVSNQNNGNAAQTLTVLEHLGL